MENRYDKFTTLILNIYRSIVKIRSSEMAALGLRGNQVQCVFHLYQNPNGLTLNELCNCCYEDKGAMSRALADLAKKGFVKESAGDKVYKNPYVLTREGLAIGKKIESLTEEMVARGSQGIKDDERQGFYKNLQLVSKNLNEVCNSYGQN